VLGENTEPIYTPLVTLGMFLGQVLDPLGSCRAAVARLLARLTATGQPACSTNTGAYCKARARLPEDALHALARRTGGTRSERADGRWLWRGRRVRIADGTTLTASDTTANQKEYPQPDGQKPGLGFPMLGLVVLFCLATGAVLEAAFCPYRGKATGEISLLRQVWADLDAGDILLGDRIYCSYFEIALLRRRGIDVVCRKHQSRRTDFRKGQRLATHDHRIEWPKPTRPDWLADAEYRALPATPAVREVRVVVPNRGFRVRRFEVITTLPDSGPTTVSDLGELYRRRWQAELDLRSLKQSMGMDQLRCKTPAMVRKELWVYLLSYNLVRGAMAESAREATIPPGSLSFKGGVDTLLAFGAVLCELTGERREATLRRLWKAVSTHRVGNRPNRVEPRAIKRRKKSYPMLNQPRKLARQRLLQTA